MKKYIIDLDSERCLFTDKQGRAYLIGKQDGHHYEGKSIVINADEQQVSYTNADGNFTHPQKDFNSVVFIGSTGHDDTPLTDIHFEATLPETNEKILYDWQGAGRDRQMLFPL